MTTSNPVEILLVDDSASDVELTMHALRKKSLARDVYVASDGKEALDYVFCRAEYQGRLFADRPKMILLDLKLPKIEGLEVLRAIRNDERTRSIPIVIFTSSKEPRDLIEGYRLGANAYVQKPVGFDEFREKVGEIGMFWLAVNEPPPAEVFAVD